MVKIIAFYLPQFHEIPENNRWWGEGFTEWTNTKKAKPLFRKHDQPKIPLNENYYCLLDTTVMENQMKLAKKYGIYGFCFYHYWYCGKKLLEKPVELMLDNPNAEFPYCFAWANESWTKTWHGGKGSKEILMEQTYGSRLDWEEHIEYLLKFFRDDHYIRIQNKPVLLVLHLRRIEKLREMVQVWNDVLKRNGFDGIYFIEMKRGYADEAEKIGIMVDASVDFEPGKTINQVKNQKWMRLNISDRIKKKLENIPFINRICREEFDYIRLSGTALKRLHQKNELWGLFTGYDDTPRRGCRATIVRNSTPKAFGKYLKAVIRRSIQENKEYIFLNAWNEWGEGAYLEPDQKYGYAYLNEIRRALQDQQYM